jgi:hypothetical protein
LRSALDGFFGKGRAALPLPKIALVLDFRTRSGFLISNSERDVADAPQVTNLRLRGGAAP